MAYPQIVYGVDDTILLFTFPPVQKPGADDRVAERHDTVTSSGLRQSVHERTDRFRDLQMDFVPAEDLPAWELFIDYALTGEEFKYYPDSELGDYSTWKLEDTKWMPKYNFRGMAKFTLRLRLVSYDIGS